MVRVDTVFRGGTVLAGASFTPTTGLAVHHGRIVALGADALELSAHRYVDLDGAVAVPGFHDAHNHMAWFGMSLEEIPLGAPDVGHVDEVYAAVAARARSQAPGTWIVGSSYDQNKLVGGHPTAAGLDRVAPNHLVWLKHTSGHMCVVSSSVLAQLDLANVPAGGDVVRDEAGAPTGLLREQAQLLLRPLVYPTPLATVERAIAAAGQHYLSEGITSVQEAGIAGGWIGRTPVELAAYQNVRRAGQLAVRVSLMVTSDVLHDVECADGDGASFGLDLGMRTGFGDDWLRLGAMKLFADGSLIGRTAAMHEDYADICCERGYFQLPELDMRETIRRAHLAGWQVATHAIGDRAVTEVVDAYAQVLAQHPRLDHRHRIEHCGVTRPEDVARIAQLGLIPVPQGRFVGEIGDGMIAALGAERSKWCYRQRSFLTAGVEVPASSDRPVVTGNPLLGMQDLVDRRTASGEVLGPDERLTARQALRAYTYGSAYAGFRESQVGTLEVGKLADLTVLSADPLLADSFTELQVVGTVVGGSVDFDAGLG